MAYWLSLLAMVVAAILCISLVSQPAKSAVLMPSAPPPPPVPPPRAEEPTPEAIDSIPLEREPALSTNAATAEEAEKAPPAPEDQDAPPKGRKLNNILLLVASAGLVLLAGGYFGVVRPLLAREGDSMKNNPKYELSDEITWSQQPQSVEDDVPASGIIIAQKNLNIRDRESTDGNKLGLLKQMEEVKVIQRGKKDIIDGIEDYWYQVSYAGKVGYVFGHYTNLKLQGRKTVLLPYSGCGFGDLFHLIFEDMNQNSANTIDFGFGKNNYSGFELCLEDSEGFNYPNPQYVGKYFKITYNDLFARTYCNAPIDYSICVKPVKTIVKLELANVNKEAIISEVSQPIHNIFSAWTQLDLASYMAQWDRNATQHSKKFSPRNYEDIQRRRRSLFGRLSNVQVLNYEITNLVKESNERAVLYVKYSMVFNFKDGKSLAESDVSEKYVLRYDAPSRRWLILNNYDYID
jgi:uncharacterized protein YgiM (DUF1202 family)